MTIRNLPNFINFCMTIGEIPSSYKASLTYEEQILWLCKFLEEEVIPVVNNNSEVVKELQTYIGNYFKNLDIQEEINNKLEEMAQNGTLEEIIIDYINLKSILCFNTILDLKNATNIINGSYVKTLGFNSINDNGSAIYKVRNILNTDIVDEKSIISINYDKNLIAELTEDKIITPEMFGAIGNGVEDDTFNIQSCINYAYNKKCKVLFTNDKIYAVQNITIDKPLAVDFNNATILSISNDISTSLINIGLATQTFEEKTQYAGKFAISNINADMNNTNRKYGVEINCRRIGINRIYVKKCKNSGIYCGGNDGIWIDQIFVSGDNETTSASGVEIDTNDIILGNVEVAYMNYGVKILSNLDDIVIDTLHVWSDVINSSAIRFDGETFYIDVHSLIIDAINWGIDLSNTGNYGKMHYGNIKVFPSINFPNWRLFRKYNDEQTTGTTIDGIYGINDNDSELRLEGFRGVIFGLSNFNQAPSRFIQFSNASNGTNFKQYNGQLYQENYFSIVGEGSNDKNLGTIGSLNLLWKNIAKFIPVTIYDSNYSIVGYGMITWLNDNTARLRSSITLSNDSTYRIVINIPLPSGYSFSN